MKVQCTTNRLRNLSKNSTYDVIKESLDHYSILNDYGRIATGNKDWFVVVPKSAKVKTIVCVHSHPWLTQGTTYDVLCEGKNFYGIIADNGVQDSYLKDCFEVVQEAKPALNKIRMIEYPTTTDDKVHLSQEKAEAHQAELDTQSFKGPFIRGIQKLGIGTMVGWASTNPESFETLVRLVREQQSNE
jgi:hypothetical protein